ncbi:hypothetical protein EAPG_04156 [Escherichia albertii B156]|nr:hypothetical protein EAPG_04156 [Escherichia albertii B156]
MFLDDYAVVRVNLAHQAVKFWYYAPIIFVESGLYHS